MKKEYPIPDYLKFCRGLTEPTPLMSKITPMVKDNGTNNATVNLPKAYF